MTWQAWTLFTLTTTALCLTPGPAVLFVVSHGLGRGRVAALWASAGILAGNTLYFVISATGLGALFLASYDVFVGVKWLGAAYLVWLGLRTAFAGDGPAAPAPACAGTAGPRTLARGFVVQASNPNALVFFTALLPQFVDPAHPVVPQIALLGVTTIVVESAVLAAYGTLAARSAALVTRPGVAAWTQRAAGALLVAAGVGMARLRRAG